MNFANMTAKEVRDLIASKDRMKLTDDDWLAVDEWITNFLKSDPPEEEKKFFAPLGWVETVTIQCDGIVRRRNAICTQCEKAVNLRECKIYGTKIPIEIWTTGKDAHCSYYREKQVDGRDIYIV